MADGRWHVGTFPWRELMTVDADGARRFYGELFGWSWRSTEPEPGETYWHATRDGKDVAGMMLRPAMLQRGKGPAYWATYVAVESAERSRDLAARLGGRILIPRVDVPKVGVISFVADPTGASFGLFEAAR